MREGERIMMDITAGFLLCVCTASLFAFPPVFACDRLQLKLQEDRPSLRVAVNDQAELKCCYEHGPLGARSSQWVMRHLSDNLTTITSPVRLGPGVTVQNGYRNEVFVCDMLTLTEVQLNDTGFYQCLLHDGARCRFSHGTYLQVYIPLQRTLNISEGWKNSIITIEGVLLLFTVLIPGICQLGKTNRITQLNKKKQMEEENIYEGLNLDDCNSTYHQIQRSNRHGPYQDVANTAEGDIQFEKP